MFVQRSCAVSYYPGSPCTNSICSGPWSGLPLQSSGMAYSPVFTFFSQYRRRISSTRSGFFRLHSRIYWFLFSRASWLSFFMTYLLAVLFVSVYTVLVFAPISITIADMQESGKCSTFRPLVEITACKAHPKFFRKQLKFSRNRKKNRGAVNHEHLACPCEKTQPEIFVKSDGVFYGVYTAENNKGRAEIL